MTVYVTAILLGKEGDTLIGQTLLQKMFIVPDDYQGLDLNFVFGAKTFQ